MTGWCDWFILIPLSLYPIIKVFHAKLWSACCWSVYVGLYCYCTPKTHSNTRLHTHSHKPPVEIYSLSFSQTHIQRECLCWVVKMFIPVFLQENKKARHQERRPTHPVLRSATPRYIKWKKNKKLVFIKCDILKVNSLLHGTEWS